jgi:hypothetical protein
VVTDRPVKPGDDRIGFVPQGQRHEPDQSRIAAMIGTSGALY